MAHAAGATRPASRYAAVGSAVSSSPTPSPSSSSGKDVSSLRRLISASGGRRGGGVSEGGSSSHGSSGAVVRMAPGDVAVKNGRDLGSMVRKFMEKRSKPKTGSSNTVKLVGTPAQIEEDLKRAVGATGKGSNLSTFHRKLFQKGKSGDAVPAKALTEAKLNTRTLAMVLRSERELLDQNREHESVILKLQSQLEDKEREVEKLKDLCLKQREEIKTLKDAILFPNAANGPLQVLQENQGPELQEANQVIPTLQKQVRSLTGQLQSLVEDLAEVRADKYSARSCFEGYALSPRTPECDHGSANSLEFSSAEQTIPGSPDDAFLEDLNPCLTPCSSKAKPKEYNENAGHNYSQGDGSLGIRIVSGSEFFNSRSAAIDSNSLSEDKLFGLFM
ncbi:unnamed protein product [Spirodela intermedia]|uniref:Uncharacterized protein n=1 Tax=Spirodela intermedia TaxID=51605 RepID=A0A7I8I7L3_SPIIN|nr:unnamed protein product [Spirodela intermedia]CAA6653606.1 unnamed protein product [Spirodela intermedia]